MEVLVEIIGEIVLAVLEEVWPPILAVVDGLLVVGLAFLAWLYFTQGQWARAVISLLAAALFLAVGIFSCRAGIFQRKKPGDRRTPRDKR